MGTALVRFVCVVDRDHAVANSPYFIGDTVMRIIPQHRGINHRAATFTHDVWLMLVNFPQECWNLDTIITSMAPYGRLLVWNRENDFRARILVKIRAYDIDRIPLSIVLLQNATDVGHGDSWSCPTFILSSEMLGVQAGDEDPLPPDGQNPHPIPIIIDDFAAWHAENEGPPAPVNSGPATPLNPEEPVILTPPQSPIQPDVAQVENNVAENDMDVALEEPEQNIALEVANQELQLSLVPGAEEPMDHHGEGEPAAASDIPENHIDMFKELISKIASSANSVLPILKDCTVTYAECKVIDVDSATGLKRKCYVQINTVKDKDFTAPSTVQIS